MMVSGPLSDAPPSRGPNGLGDAVGAGGGDAGAGRPSRAALVTAVLLAGYKRFISPFLLPACRFEPTCSVYARQAVLRYGFTRGAGLAIRRLARCHPFNPGSVDPVS